MLSGVELAAWPIDNGDDHTNEGKLTLRRTHVLRWMTIRGYNVAVCNSQSDQLTLLTPAVTVLSCWEGNRRSGIADSMVYLFTDSMA